MLPLYLKIEQKESSKSTYKRRQKTRDVLYCYNACLPFPTYMLDLSFGQTTDRKTGNEENIF